MYWTSHYFQNLKLIEITAAMWQKMILVFSRVLHKILAELCTDPNTIFKIYILLKFGCFTINGTCNCRGVYFPLKFFFFSPSEKWSILFFPQLYFAFFCYFNANPAKHWNCPPKCQFFLAGTRFLQRKHEIWYRWPLRPAQLTTKLPLFNTNTIFFPYASFLQSTRYDTGGPCSEHDLWRNCVGSYFVQIKLVLLQNI